MPHRERLIHLLDELRRGLMEEAEAWPNESTVEALSDALDYCRQIEECVFDIGPE